MHYKGLFRFKASSVQRYFFLDNLILCCSYSESQTELRAIAELSSPTREICRPTTSYLMMQQLEHAARRSHRDGNQPNSAILPDQCLFCKKSKYKPDTKTREKLHSVQEVCADDLMSRIQLITCYGIAEYLLKISHSPSIFSYMPSTLMSSISKSLIGSHMCTKHMKIPFTVEINYKEEIAQTLIKKF